MSETTDLAVLEIKPEQAPALYVANGLDAYLDQIRELAAEVPDVTTKKGRDRIGSLARMVGSSKKAIEEPGRAYLKQLKEAVKPAEDELRRFTRECDTIRDQILAPRAAWDVEQERIKQEEAARLQSIKDAEQREAPIIYRDESLRTTCSPDGFCSNDFGLELKCPFTSRDFVKFRLGGFDAIKSAYMAQVQYSMWVTGKDAWFFANYDPRMKREGIHHVVVERDEKFMAEFDTHVPDFIEKMDLALAEIGFTFGDQWR